MKFDYIDGSVRNVSGMEFRNPFVLQNRSCSRCGSDQFYEVMVTYVDNVEQLKVSRPVARIDYMAMCEGCKGLCALQ